MVVARFVYKLILCFVLICIPSLVKQPGFMGVGITRWAHLCQEQLISPI